MPIEDSSLSNFDSIEYRQKPIFFSENSRLLSFSLLFSFSSLCCRFAFGFQEKESRSSTKVNAFPIEKSQFFLYCLADHTLLASTVITFSHNKSAHISFFIPFFLNYVRTIALGSHAPISKIRERSF